MPSKEFTEIIERMKEIHLKKNADYANESNPFSNFEIQAEILKHFTNDIDRAFVGLIAVKLARLSELLSSGKTPNNESIDDTFLDLANYCVLWGAYYKFKSNKLVKEFNDIYQCKKCGIGFSYPPLKLNAGFPGEVTYFFCSMICKDRFANC